MQVKQAGKTGKTTQALPKRQEARQTETADKMMEKVSKPIF